MKEKPSQNNNEQKKYYVYEVDVTKSFLQKNFKYSVDTPIDPKLAKSKNREYRSGLVFTSIGEVATGLKGKSKVPKIRNEQGKLVSRGLVNELKANQMSQKYKYKLAGQINDPELALSDDIALNITKNKNPNRKSEKLITYYKGDPVIIGYTEVMLSDDKSTLHKEEKRFHKRGPYIKTMLGEAKKREVGGLYLPIYIVSDQKIKEEVGKKNPLKEGVCFISKTAAWNFVERTAKSKLSVKDRIEMDTYGQEMNYVVDLYKTVNRQPKELLDNKQLPNDVKKFLKVGHLLVVPQQNALLLYVKGKEEPHTIKAENLRKIKFSDIERKKDQRSNFLTYDDPYVNIQVGEDEVLKIKMNKKNMDMLLKIAIKEKFIEPTWQKPQKPQDINTLTNYVLQECRESFNQYNNSKKEEKSKRSNKLFKNESIGEKRAKFYNSLFNFNKSNVDSRVKKIMGLIGLYGIMTDKKGRGHSKRLKEWIYNSIPAYSQLSNANAVKYRIKELLSELKQEIGQNEEQDENVSYPTYQDPTKHSNNPVIVDNQVASVSETETFDDIADVLDLVNTQIANNDTFNLAHKLALIENNIEKAIGKPLESLDEEVSHSLSPN